MPAVSLGSCPLGSGLLLQSQTPWSSPPSHRCPKALPASRHAGYLPSQPTPRFISCTSGEAMQKCQLASLNSPRLHMLALSAQSQQQTSKALHGRFCILSSFRAVLSRHTYVWQRWPHHRGRTSPSAHPCQALPASSFQFLCFWKGQTERRGPGSDPHQFYNSRHKERQLSPQFS